MQREWEALQGARLGHALQAWSLREPALKALSPRALLLVLRQATNPDRKDEILAALVRTAARDPLAGRLLIEALLPGLKVIARRLIAQGRDREEVWAAVLAHAWIRIQTYPLSRRPRRIAANILLDTLRLTLRDLDSGRHQDEIPLESIEEAEARPDQVSVDSLVFEAVVEGALSPADAELVVRTRFGGETLAEVAASAAVPYNTVKVRRQRAERRLLVFLGYSPTPRGRQRRRALA
jgi:DNA-directed RNA polymerase specialized sigma24 family protein